MTMTKGDAACVQALLSWVCGTNDGPSDAVRAAAERLANRSSASLQAGIRGDVVLERWPEAAPAGGTR